MLGEKPLQSQSFPDFLLETKKYPNRLPVVWLYYCRKVEYKQIATFEKSTTIIRAIFSVGNRLKLFQLMAHHIIEKGCT